MKLLHRLKKFANERIIVETKDNKKFIGKIEKIDSEMNIHLIENDKKKDEHKKIVKGSNIRYIIFRKNFSFEIDEGKNDLKVKRKKDNDDEKNKKVK